MLQAQAFEGLFTLVPILLIAVVSILLRARAARRRRQNQDGEAKPVARTEVGARAAEAPVEKPAPSGEERLGAPGQAFGPPQSSGTWQPFGAEKPSRSKQSTAPLQPPRPAAANREAYAYPLPLPRNGVQEPEVGALSTAPVIVSQPVNRLVKRTVVGVEALPGKKDLRARMMDREQNGSAERIPAVDKRSTIVSRLEKLPPFKRAVIWAEILGPPGGRG